MTPKLHELLPVQPAVCAPCPPIQAPIIPYQQFPEDRSSWLHVSPPNPTTLRPKLIRVLVRREAVLISFSNVGSALIRKGMGSHLFIANSPQTLAFEPVQTLVTPVFVFVQTRVIVGGMIWKARLVISR